MNEVAIMPDGVQDNETLEGVICPICGGNVIEIHCVARCTRCHTIIDTCCEGLRMPSRAEPSPNDAVEATGKQQKGTR